MRVLDGKNYLTIGEVAKIVERSPQTIKYWYKWYDEQTDAVKSENVLPKTRRDLDAKGTHYFLEDDMEALAVFRDLISYGKMSEFNNRRWGERGTEIRERKKEPRTRKPKETDKV